MQRHNNLISRHNHFPAGLKCIMDLCACRTHLPKILHLAELIFWIDVFQTTQNSPAETHSCGRGTCLLKQTHSRGTKNSPAETHSCGMWNSHAETDTFPWNAELTCWNRHVPVPCITYLLDWTLCLEQDTSSQQFSKNAAHTPYINCGWIVTRSHQNLWCTVVLCYHFLCHMFWLIWLLYACQTKVTDLQTQQKTWLHVLHNKVK